MMCLHCHDQQLELDVVIQDFIRNASHLNKATVVLWQAHCKTILFPGLHIALYMAQLTCAVTILFVLPCYTLPWFQNFNKLTLYFVHEPNFESHYHPLHCTNHTILKNVNKETLPIKEIYWQQQHLYTLASSCKALWLILGMMQRSPLTVDVQH